MNDELPERARIYTRQTLSLLRPSTSVPELPRLLADTSAYAAQLTQADPRTLRFAVSIRQWQSQ